MFQNQITELKGTLEGITEEMAVITQMLATKKEDVKKITKAILTLEALQVSVSPVEVVKEIAKEVTTQEENDIQW